MPLFCKIVCSLKMAKMWVTLTNDSVAPGKVNSSISVTYLEDKNCCTNVVQSTKYLSSTKFVIIYMTLIDISDSKNCTTRAHQSSSQSCAESALGESKV